MAAANEETSSKPPDFPSTVYREVLTVEVIWTEDGNHRDWAGTIRGAIWGDEWPAWVGQIVTDGPQELDVAPSEGVR